MPAPVKIHFEPSSRESKRLVVEAHEFFIYGVSWTLRREGLKGWWILMDFWLVFVCASVYVVVFVFFVCLGRQRLTETLRNRLDRDRQITMIDSDRDRCAWSVFCNALVTSHLFPSFLVGEGVYIWLGMLAISKNDHQDDSIFSSRSLLVFACIYLLLGGGTIQYITKTCP